MGYRLFLLFLRCFSPFQKWSPQPITTQCCILTHYRYIAVENIVRIGEIACNKQFLLLSQCFLPYMALIFQFKCTLKVVCNSLPIWTSLEFWLLTTLYKKSFENTVGKGENAGNQHFLLFPQCFQPFPKQISIFQSHLFCRLQMISIWTSLKFCCLVKK